MTQRASATDGAARLGQELKLLVEEIVEHSPWLDPVAATHDAAAADSSPSGNRCGWCPLCAAVELARGERPEMTARVLDQSTQLVALLRAVLADRWHPADGVHMPGFARDDEQPAPAAEDDRPREPHGAGSPRVQRVAVRRAALREGSD